MRTTAHALESFSTLHAPNPNQNATKLVTTIGFRLSLPPTVLLLVVTLQCLDSSSGCSSLHPSALKLRLPHLLHQLTPVCNSASSSSFFHRVVAPASVLVHLTHRRAPWTSLPLFAGVAALLACSPAPRRAAYPHVGHGPQPTLEAPREGLRQGDVRGGGWTEAEPPALRNQMLRGIRHPARTVFRLSKMDTETPLGRPEFSNNELITKCASQPHI